MIGKYIAVAVTAIVIVLTSTATVNLETVTLHKPQPKPEYSKNDIDCLAQNIYYEARNQSSLGQIAVAHVVLNRVKDEDFPATICGVVKQAKFKDGKVIRHQCQFSWFCDGTNLKTRNQEAWSNAIRMAQQALKLYKVKDVTNGATFYHASYVRPSWSRKFIKVLRVDDHIFYRRTEA